MVTTLSPGVATMEGKWEKGRLIITAEHKACYQVLLEACSSRQLIQPLRVEWKISKETRILEEIVPEYRVEMKVFFVRTLFLPQ
jgi:hypothetical protein